ncbi:hypothetical protein ACFLSH_03075 [Bacteroidota bacterium]
MIYKDAGSIPLYRLKETNEVSPFVGQLAVKAGKVSLDPAAIKSIRKYGRLVGYQSVFNEIEFINPASSIKENYKSYNRIQNLFNTDYWADLIIEYLMNWARSNIKQDKEYWIMHSSGGDSRILSALFANLRDNEGFLPNIKFVSWYPEATQSEKILKHLGWQSEYIWNVGDEKNENLTPENYWNNGNSYDFNDCGYITNGEIQPFGSCQSNFWKPYHTDVSGITIVMAMIGDMIMGARWWIRWMKRFWWDKGFPNYSSEMKLNIIIATSARYNGLGLLGYIRNFRELLTPTMDFEMVNIGVQIPIICRYNDNIRIRIMEKLSPGLSKFKNESGGWIKHTSGLMNNAYEDYFKSEFYKRYNYDDYFPNRGDTAIPFLSLASLYDYLIKQNIQID